MTHISKCGSTRHIVFSVNQNDVMLNDHCVCAECNLSFLILFFFCCFFVLLIFSYVLFRCALPSTVPFTEWWSSVWISFKILFLLDENLKKKLFHFEVKKVIHTKKFLFLPWTITDCFNLKKNSITKQQIQ